MASNDRFERTLMMKIVYWLRSRARKCKPFNRVGY